MLDKKQSQTVSELDESKNQSVNTYLYDRLICCLVNNNINSKYDERKIG